MIKLIDRLGTAYLTTNYCGEIRSILDTGEDLDMAGAHICSDVMQRLISASYEGRVIVDSADADRNCFFEDNRRRGELSRKFPALTPLKLPDTMENLITAIQALDASKEYQLVNGQNVAEVAYAAIVQMARPDIRLHLQSAVPELLRMVHAQITSSDTHWTEFYQLLRQTFIIVTVPDDENYTEFISSNVVVPTVFGRECLVNKPEWSSVVEGLSNILSDTLRPVGQHIRDYL